MDENLTYEQARTIATLLPGLMRNLTAALEHDPVAELPLAQLRVCLILYEGPRTMSAVARELGVTLSAMTQIADRLERAGLVTRVAEGSDRRVRRLELTPHGQQLLRLREEAFAQRVAAALQRLAPKARQKVVSAFKTLTGAAAAARLRDVVVRTG